MTTNSAHRRVLVLGGTGLSGAAIARAYLAVGVPVTLVARTLPSGPEWGWLDGVEFVVGPAEEPAVLEVALEGVDHVVHALGAPPPAAMVDDPLEHHRLVVAPLVGLLDLVRKRPGVGLTYLSSGGAVYGNPAILPVPETHACHPLSAYGVTKLAAEATIGMYAHRHGVHAWVLRVANVYGPEQRPWTGQGAVATFLDAARTGRPITLYGGGTAVRDYIEVSDLAAATVALSERRDGYGVVNVGSGTGHSTREVMEIVQATTGHRLAVEWEPARGTDVDAVYLDTSRLESLMKWEPVGLEAGVAAMWDSWQASWAWEHSAELAEEQSA
jgi:UDP-glucose 4-epimerase